MTDPSEETAPVRGGPAGRVPPGVPPTPGGADAAGPSVPDPGVQELSSAVAALTDEEIDASTRRRLLVRVVREEIRERGLTNLMKPGAALRWVVDSVTNIAPYLPVRDLETLRRHHGDLPPAQLADRLIRNAARVTAGIGAAGGGVSAIEWVVTPTLLSTPVLLAAETVAVVAVEMKLIGELQEVYGQPVPGGGAARSVGLLQAWANRRGVNPLVPGRGAAAVLGTATRKELRDRLVRRYGRSLTTLGPLLTGAAVAAFLNRRATRSLGDEVSRDLQRRLRTLDLPHQSISEPPGLPRPAPPAVGS